MSGGWQDLYAFYTHTVYTSGMQEVSSACPTGRLQPQLNFGCTADCQRHVSLLSILVQAVFLFSVQTAEAS